MMKINQMDSENRNPAADAAWELWYQDLFDQECPRKIEMSGQGLVPGLAKLWALHLFETVQADGQKGFSHFNLWWRQKQKSIEINGAWDGMVRLRNWVFGNKRTASRGYLDDGDRELLMGIALAHSCLIMAGQSSEAILAAAQNCAGREVFQEQLKNWIQAKNKEN
jgi:hypothetical protein